MQQRQKILSKACFADRQLANPLKGVVIHYFSCANVVENPANKFDTEECLNLFEDLNRPKSERRNFLVGQGDPVERMYASAHYLIPRDSGEYPVLMVPLHMVAYHAGKSSFNGLVGWNEFSVGIELIGDATSGFTDYQYDCASWICGRLMAVHRFPLGNVVGHEEVAPGRKVDPGIATGNFDMGRLRRSLESW